jgi:hypothetical protein
LSSHLREESFMARFAILLCAAFAAFAAMALALPPVPAF